MDLSTIAIVAQLVLVSIILYCATKNEPWDLYEPECSKKCTCGGKSFSFIGIQKGPRHNLNLFNCKDCRTTIAEKVS